MLNANDPTITFPVKVPLNPTVVHRLDGSVVVGSGDVWVRVPATTTREDMNRWVVWTPPGRPQRNDIKKVKGSKGSVYTLRKMPDGRVICSCPGHKWRGKCKHQAMF